MASVCFYFQVHQPFRLRRYSVFDTDRHYFDDYKNAEICRKVAHKCYIPANRTLLDTIRVHEGRFRIAYSITDTQVLQDFVADARKALVESAKAITKIGEIEATAALQKPLKALSDKVLHPLLPAIEKYEEWIICPDGALWLTGFPEIPCTGD